MTAIPVRSYAWGGAQGMQWCRNGRHPDAHLMTKLVDHANHLALCRVQEYASFGQSIDHVPAGDAGGADRHRWRFQFHSSPYARFVWVQFVLTRSTVNTYNPGARLRIETAAGATVGDAEWRYGLAASHGSESADAFGYAVRPLASAGAVVEITPDTDFRGTFTDLGGGRLVAACAYEWGLQPDDANGYLPNGYSFGTPIYDEDRFDLATMLRLLWKRQSGKLFVWSSDSDVASPTNNSTTDKNALDTTITTVGTGTPGFVVDLSNRSTVRRASSGVPCVFWAYGKCTSSGNGRVYLKNSAGTVLATISGFTASDGWAQTTVNLPTTIAKYDVHFEALAGTTTLRAAGLYQYEA